MFGRLVGDRRQGWALLTVTDPGALRTTQPAFVMFVLGSP
jgi:hypothetical protein